MGLFNMFTNHKPMIVDAINNAKHEEDKLVIKMIDNIVKQIKDGKIKKEDLSDVWFMDKFKTKFEEVNSKKRFVVSGASSREMYQALLLIAPNAEYKPPDVKYSEYGSRYHLASADMNEYFIKLYKYDNSNDILVYIDIDERKILESILEIIAMDDTFKQQPQKPKNTQQHNFNDVPYDDDIPF